MCGLLQTCLIVLCICNFFRDYHCGLIGYQVKKKVRASVFAENSSHSVPHGGLEKPILLGQSSPSMTRVSEAFGEVLRNNSKQGKLLKMSYW